jgi:hypothetical protein
MYGQETTQPNNQQTAQPVATPTLPPAQNPAWMQKADPNDLSFLFNEESGQLEIVQKQAQPTSDPKFQQAVETQQATQAQQQPEQLAIPIEQEVSQLKTALAQLVGYLQAKEQAQPQLNNLSQPQEQTVDYSQIDFQDPNNIVALINTAVANAVKQHIDPLNSAVNQVQVKNNFDMTAAKYGKDFLDVLPKINVLVQAGILKSDPNMSFENLYLAFKQMERLNGQSAPSDSTIQTVNGSNGNGQSRQPQTVQALAQRANALSTESGGVQRNIINNDRPRANTIAEATEQAWEELFGRR